MKKILIITVFLFAASVSCVSDSRKIQIGSGLGDSWMIFSYSYLENYATIEVEQNGEIKLQAQVGITLNTSDLVDVNGTVENCYHSPSENYTLCTDVPYDLGGDAFTISWRTTNKNLTFRDCYLLNATSTHWYGGEENYNQDWPVEKLNVTKTPYITNGHTQGAVKETYWLNSRGAYVFVERSTPLFLDINQVDDHICFEARTDTPYIEREELTFNYTLAVRSNAREAHLHAVDHYLNKAKVHPNDKMIKEPIWTTWAKYKTQIDDEVVRNFSKDIADNGYNGQIEIDDKWETCYGSLEFDTSDTFKDINETVKYLKDLGFRVTLWVHPFVDDDCEAARIGEQHDYFVKNTNGKTNVSWWDNSNSHYIDFTRESPRQWFIQRLKKIQQLHGIDNFKFDAGEATWSPNDSVYNASVETWPNVITEDYVRTCATFGDLLEVRSAWNSQDLGIFVRMVDKDSRWGYDNGLKSLVTTLLQMNIAGYSMVLPDMIGGNGYGGVPPTPELMVRWTQANTFMPSMQFSYLPWELNSTEINVPEIVRKYIKIHSDYSGEILNAMDKHLKDGSPVNAPVWWVDPTNKDLLSINDEFLLGENILVAPILDPNTFYRDVVLPSGNWTDQNYGKLYQGPTVVKNYYAPIEILPWFVRTPTM